jgi:hypothetical protein
MNNDFTALEKYIRDHWTKKYFIEKTPNSISCLPQLNKHFPEAHYIFQRGDPLKIALYQINFLEQPERRTNANTPRSAVRGEIQVAIQRSTYYQVRGYGKGHWSCTKRA